jgi:hypothetical protein
MADISLSNNTVTTQNALECYCSLCSVIAVCVSFTTFSNSAISLSIALASATVENFFVVQMRIGDF